MFRKLLVVSSLVIGLAGAVVPVAPVEGAKSVSEPVTVPAGFEEVAIFAANSVHIKKSGRVTGDVVVNDFSAGPTLSPGYEIKIDLGSTVTGDVTGDSVHLESGVAVSGTVSYNDLANAGSAGSTSTPLPLPVYAAPPAFQLAAVRDGAADVVVPAGGTATLAPGDHGHVSVGDAGTVIFTGGLYNLLSLSAPGAGCKVLFKAPTDLRIVGRFDLGRAATIGPHPGSGGGASDIVVYIGGANGGDGTPSAEPAAAQVGRDSHIAANLWAGAGTLKLDRGAVATGALFGRDVSIEQDGSVTADTYFRNRPPVADPKTVFTAGTAPIGIVLTGSDPEGDSLIFSIASGPGQGSLSDPVPVIPPPVSSCSVSGGGCTVDPDCPLAGETCDSGTGAFVAATVTYTPGFGDDREDSFVYQVTDPTGGFGQATVRINPPGDPTPPQVPLTTIEAHDAAATTGEEIPILIALQADAPCEGACDGVGDDVPLTFAILSGPAHGELTGFAESGGTPNRRATVTYTPDAGFVSPPADSITFEACGILDGVPACDQATITITVVEIQAVADDQKVVTPPDVPVEITLTGSPGISGPGPVGGGLVAILGRAAFLQGAEVAGNVADATGDGFGDNHNALPGSAPVLMAAGVDASGGAGSNGVMRMQVEWDVSNLGGTIESAVVTLTTSKGTVDSLDTFFFAGTGEQDGLLTDGDFEAPAAVIDGAVMPVPDVANGTQGTFTFDVRDEVVAAIAADRDFFSIQGRVDEGLAGQGFQRGLQVHTTASGNLIDGFEPKLAITTPGVVAPSLTFTITALPAFGTLRNSQGSPITAVPTALLSPVVTYTPAAEFIGAVEFTFQVFDGVRFADGLVSVIVGFGFGDCATDATSCNNGR